MTLTPEQEARKKLWIQKNGLDPEQFDYDVENDVFVPRTPTAEQQPQEVVPPNGSSPLKTAVKAAAYNLPEATGGLAAAGAGALAGAPLGPVGSIAGGLIGGFGGSALAGKAKEAALEIPFVRRAAEYLGMSPEEMAKEQQTNPKAFLAGELGSNLPFFSVSGGIRGVGRAAGALRSLPLPTRMPAQDIAALGNVAIGAGLGAGQSIGSDLISGRDINWGQAAAQTAAGALLNSPRRLGTMVSLGTMKPMPGDEIGARFNEASRLAQNATPVKPPTAAAAPAEPAIPEAGGIRFPVSVFELKKLRAPNAEKLGEPEIATVGSRTMSFGDQEKLAKWQRQQVESERRAREFKLAQAEKNKQDARQILREAGEPFPEEGTPQNVVPTPATPEKLTHTRVGTDVARPETRPENPVDQLMGEAEPRSEAEILQDEMEGTGARYSPARKQKAPVTTEPITFSSEAKPPAEPESQLPAGLVAAIQHLGGKKYRTDVEVTGEPIVMGHAQEGVPAGTLARGVMQPRANPAEQTRIQLSRQLGLPETPAHELIEGVIHDLNTHGTQSEKNFIKRFADAFGGLDPAIDAAASDFTGVLRDPKKGGIVQDWMDFIKYKMGRASRQEMARMMSNVLRRGAGAEEVLPRINTGTAGAARYSALKVSGSNIRRMLDQLSSGMYNKGLPETIAKETLQNAYDAVRNNTGEKKIFVESSFNSPTFAVMDNGVGMSPTTVATKLLPAFETGKKAKENAGGFGIAKIANFGSTEKFHVVTVGVDETTGKKYRTELLGTSEGWKDFASNPENIVETGVGAHDINKNLHMFVQEVPEDTQTGTHVRYTLPKLPESEDTGAWRAGSYGRRVLETLRLHGIDGEHVSFDLPENNLQGLPAYDTKYKIKTDKPSRIQKVTNPTGGRVELWYDETAPLEDPWSIDISNNGLPQFDYKIQGDAKLPKGLRINIIPNVETTNSNYPFTLNRDELKGEVKTHVEELIKKLAFDAKNKETQELLNVYKTAPKIKGTKFVVADMTRNVAPEVLNKVANDPSVVQLAGAVNKTFRRAFKELASKLWAAQTATDDINFNHFRDVDFRGFVVAGTDFFGVRIGAPQAGSHGDIYISPFATLHSIDKVISQGFYSPEKFGEAFAERLVGTLVHELAHQVSASEGEGHAKALTVLQGSLRKTVNNAVTNIERIFAADPQFRERLQRYADQINRVDTTRADTLLGALRKQGAEGGADSMGTDVKIESARNTGNAERYSPAEGSENTKNTVYAEYFRRMKEAAANAKPAELPAEREIPNRTPEQRIEDRRANSQEHVNWRYSPASDRFGQINNPDEIKGEGFSFFTPLTEKLARSGNAMKEHFAKKFLDLTNKQREMWGGWMNGMLEARGNLSPQEWNNVYHTLVDEGRKHADLSAGLNPNELDAYHKIRTIYEEMGKNRLAAGQLVSGRAGGVDPHGMFEVIDRDVLRVMLEHANTPQAQQLRQEFIDHQVNNGVTPAKAEQKLKTLLGHFGEITDLQNNFKFNAVRTPEGVGLPDSWIEKDFDAAIRRYTRRFATDRAFFDVIEKDPRMMSALGADKMANGAAIPPAHAVGPDNLVGGDPAVRTLLASYIGTDLGHREPFHASLGRFVNSLILGGPITKLTDLGSVPFHALRYVRTQDIPGLLASMANWKNGYANAFKTGLNKRGGLIVATEILGAHEQAARALDRAAEFVTKATGSEQLELLSRGLAQAMGEFIGRTQRGLALGGDKHAKAFLEKLGSDWQSASAEELGTRVAKLMQGRYDLTNMPAWMRTSPIAPFFSMMRWSVEQWNNFRNFAVQPAMQGNVMPLAHSLIGAVAGGALINEMRQTIAGKKPYTATEEELNAASEAGAPGVDKERIYKWIAAANITGTMGIVGEMTRQLYEVATQKTPQGFQYPVAGVLQDIALRGASAMAAIHDGEDPAEIAGQYVKDIAKDNVQIIRLAMNAYARANPESEEGKQLEYKNRRRDVTMFNSLYGYPVSKSPKAFPEYSGQSERELDAEQNPQKAARLATNLTQRALKRAKGNPAILESELRKLRTAPNLIMPSPDQDPIRFAQYYKYIQATQGPDKARALLHDYYRNNALREMKRDMIPSVSSR